MFIFLVILTCHFRLTKKRRTKVHNRYSLYIEIFIIIVIIKLRLFEIILPQTSLNCLISQKKYAKLLKND